MSDEQTKPNEGQGKDADPSKTTQEGQGGNENPQTQGNESGGDQSQGDQSQGDQSGDKEKSDKPKDEGKGKGKQTKQQQPKSGSKRMVLAPGQSRTTKRGILVNGDEVKPEYLNGGKDSFNRLVKQGVIVKEG